MRLLYINFRQARIVLHHLQTAVSQERLQCEDIATASQVGDRKRMPKPMRIAVGDLRFVAERVDQLAQTIFVQPVIELGKKHRGMRFFCIFALGKITPQGTARGFAQEHDTSLAAFRTTPNAVLDFQASGLLIVIAKRQRAKFIRAQSRVEQRQDQRAIAFRRSAAS